MAWPPVKTWVTETNHEGPPANPGTATPYSGEAITAEFQAAKDYIDSRVVVIGEAVHPTGGDDTGLLNTACQSVGANGKVRLEPGATFRVNAAVNNGCIKPADGVWIEGQRAKIKVASAPTGNSGVLGVAEQQSLYVRDLLIEGPDTYGVDTDSLYGVIGNPINSYAWEIIFRDCDFKGLVFGINTPVSRRVLWAGGKVDGNNIGATQQQCSAILTSDPSNRFEGAWIEVEGGAYFTRLGGQMGGGQHHAVYGQYPANIRIDGAIFDPILYGSGSVICPHQGSAPDYEPMTLIRHVYILGGDANAYGLIQCSRYGVTRITDSVVDGRLPITFRGGLNYVSGLRLRNSGATLGTALLEDYSIVGNPYIRVHGCDFDTTNMSKGVWVNNAGVTWHFTGKNRWTGADANCNADIYISAASTVEEEDSHHESVARAVWLGAGATYRHHHVKYRGGNDAIEIPVGSVAALHNARSDEWSTTGGQSGGIHKAGTVTTEEIIDPYGSNKPAATGGGVGAAAQTLPRSVAVDTTIGANELGVAMTASGKTVTLPTAADIAANGGAGKSWVVLFTVAGTCTVSTGDTRKINPYTGVSPNDTHLDLATQGEVGVFCLAPNGSDFWRIG